MPWACVRSTSPTPMATGPASGPASSSRRGPRTAWRASRWRRHISNDLRSTRSWCELPLASASVSPGEVAVLRIAELEFSGTDRGFNSGSPESWLPNSLASRSRRPSEWSAKRPSPRRTSVLRSSPDQAGKIRDVVRGGRRVLRCMSGGAPEHEHPVT
jgi:hypothetical protein